MKSDTPNYDKLFAMIKEMKFTMLTSVASDGTIHSRPMGTLEIDEESFNGVLWFFSKKNSAKNYELRNDQHVNLAYANPDKHHYVSICGHAFISHDRHKMNELWDASLGAWFPEGIDDPELSLIGVRVESAEIWDAPPGKITQLIGKMKTTVTGRAPERRTNSEHLELRHYGSEL